MPKQTEVRTRDGEIRIGCNDEVRNFAARAEIVDAEKRIVKLTASSEYPVLRYDWANGEYYDEILSHEPKHVDLSRMEDGGPILDKHHGDQVAVVETTPTFTAEKKMELDARFSKVTPRAQIIYDDVEDGIRRNVSVGYTKTAIVSMDEPTKDNKLVRKQVRFAWQPFETSFEPVPADPTVGVGRSRNGQDEPDALELPFFDESRTGEDPASGDETQDNLIIIY